MDDLLKTEDDDLIKWAESLAKESPMAAVPPRGSRKSAYTQAELEDALRRAGFKDESLVGKMGAIGMAEAALDAQGRARMDSFNPGVGPGGRPTKERSAGPWQINTLAHPEYDKQRLLSDIDYNAKAAHDIFYKKKQGLKAWGAYTDGRYRKFYKGKPVSATSSSQQIDEASIWADVDNVLSTPMNEAAPVDGSKMATSPPTTSPTFKSPVAPIGSTPFVETGITDASPVATPVSDELKKTVSEGLQSLKVRQGYTGSSDIGQPAMPYSMMIPNGQPETPESKAASAKYDEWRTAAGLDDTPETRKEYNDVVVPTINAQSQEASDLYNKDVEEYNASLPKGQQRVVRESRTSQRQAGPQAQEPRVAGVATDDLTGIYKTVTVDPKWNDERKLRTVFKGELTGDEINNLITRLRAEGKPLIQTGSNRDRTKVGISRQNIADARAMATGDVLQDAMSQVRSEARTVGDQRMEQAQNYRSPAVSRSNPISLPESQAEKALDKRIQESDYSAQARASRALKGVIDDPLKYLITPWGLASSIEEGVKGASADIDPAQEKARLKQQYGSYSKAWDAEQEYRNEPGAITAARVLNQTARSFAKNLVSGTAKSVAYLDRINEDLNPVFKVMPEEYRPSVRNIVNGADFLVRLVSSGDGATAYREWDRNSDKDDLIATTLFKAANEFDQAVGDDPVLKGRFLGEVANAQGSALSFIALGAVMPSLRLGSAAARQALRAGLGRQVAKLALTDFATGASGSFQMMGTGYEEGRRAGLSETDAKIYGGFQGLLGVSEMVGAGNELAHLIKNPIMRGKLAQSFLELGKQVGKGAAREGKQEFAQELFQTVSGNAVLEYLKDDKDTYQKVVNLLNRLPGQIAKAASEEALYGAITGGATGGATAAAQHVANSNAVGGQIRDAQQTQEPQQEVVVQPESPSSKTVVADKKGNTFTVLEDQGEKLKVQDEKGVISVRNADRLTLIDEKSKVQEPPAFVVEGEDVSTTKVEGENEAPVEAKPEPPIRYHEKMPQGLPREAPLTGQKGFEIVGKGEPKATTSIGQITERRKKAEEQLAIDPRTGLGSSTAWSVAQPRIEADPNQEVISLDINRMKDANDTTSHPFIDEKVIAPLGQVIERVLKKHGISTRNAFTPKGDEAFVAVPKGKAKQIRDEIEKEFGSVEIVAEKDYVNDRTGEKFSKGDVIPVTLSGDIGQTVKLAEKNLDKRKEASKAANPVRRVEQKGQSTQVDLRVAFPDIEATVTDSSDGKTIRLDRVIVPKGKRGQGKGSAFMNRLVEIADKKGKVLTLTPSTDFGGSSVARLRKFYKQFGFVDNKGRDKDFSISDSMYRPAPKKSAKQRLAEKGKSNRANDIIHQAGNFDVRRSPQGWYEVNQLSGAAAKTVAKFGGEKGGEEWLQRAIADANRRAAEQAKPQSPAREVEKKKKAAPKQSAKQRLAEKPSGLQPFSTAKEGEIYQDKGRILVRGDGNRGVGDRIFDTIEDAKEYIAAEEKRAANRAKQDAVAEEWRQRHEAVEAEREAEKKRGLEDFTAKMSPMQRGKVETALAKLWTYKGKPVSTKKIIEGFVAEGDVRLTTEEVPKIKDMTRQQFNRSTNEQQAAHERRQKEAGTKTVYSVNDHELGKIAYDYAKFLKEQAAPAKPASPAREVEKKAEAKKPRYDQASTEKLIQGARDEIARLDEEAKKYDPSTPAGRVRLQKVRKDQDAYKRDLKGYEADLKQYQAADNVPAVKESARQKLAEKGAKKAQTVADVPVLPKSERVSPNADPTATEARESVKKEKVSERTGLTKTQTEFLAQGLQDAVYDAILKETGFNTIEEFKVEWKNAADPDKFSKTDLKMDNFIKVPGDGNFKVNSIAAANRLHQKITGQPISGFIKAKNATIPKIFDFKRDTKSPSLGKPSKEVQAQIEAEQRYFQDILALNPYARGGDWSDSDTFANYPEGTATVERWKKEAAAATDAELLKLIKPGENTTQSKIARLELAKRNTAVKEAQSDPLQMSAAEDDRRTELLNQLRDERSYVKRQKIREELFGGKDNEYRSVTEGSRADAYEPSDIESLQMAADFDQPGDYDFKTSEYRPAVVKWAKDQWGDAIAPNGKPIYQNFVRFFGDSKVVDADGKPLRVFHGTPESFDVFDERFIGTHGTGEGQGFYFTDNRDVALAYGPAMEVFLKIEKPLSPDRKTITKSQFKSILRKVDPTGDAYLSNWGDVDYEGYERVLNEAVSNEYADAENDVELAGGLFNAGVTFEQFQKASGYDGSVTRGKYDNGQTVYVVFNTRNIKSATDNQGTFDPNEDSILQMAAEGQPTFFSQVERTIEAKMPNRASAEQIKGILSPANGVKQEERDWLDLDSFLADLESTPRRLITKDEVLAYVRANNVQVEEVEKGGKPSKWDGDDLIVDGERIANLVENEDGTWTYLSDNSDGSESFATRAEAQREAESILDDPYYEGPGTKFSQFTLPGGESYRELLLTLPDKKFEYPVRVFDKATGRTVERFAGGLAAERYITQNDPQFETLDYEDDGGKGEAYRSPHWSEPNVLAHVRFDERDGGKTLHIAEIQSDWHQEGRKKGYQDPKEQARQLADLRQQELAARETFNKAEEDFQKARKAEQAAKDKAAAPVLKKYGVDSFSGLLTKPNAKIEYFRLVNSDPAVQAAADASEAAHDVMKAAATPLTDIVGRIQEVAEPNKYVGNVPNAPFKKSWHELVFKRMLRYASENGYDRITWDTGETNADRYDLSKQVDKITVATRTNAATGEKSKSVIVDLGQGPSMNLGVSNEGVIDNVNKSEYDSLIGKPLEDALGKEIADKILNQGMRELSGLDLKVGGEGMKGFYDKILPSFANKYTKKWGGRVQNAELPIKDPERNLKAFEVLSEDDTPFSSGSNRIDAEDSLRRAREMYPQVEWRIQDNRKLLNAPVHSLTITPAMKDAVMQGQPLFMEASDTALSRFKDVQYAHTQTLLEGAKSEIKEVDGQTILELNEEAAELARRTQAEMQQKAVTPFYGSTYTAPMLRKLASTANKVAAEYIELGYTPAQVKSFRTLAANFIELANQAHGVAYVFDFALPHETHHKLVLDALNGKPFPKDVLKSLEALDIWTANPTITTPDGVSKPFKSAYPRLSKQAKAFEIAAMLETGEIVHPDKNKFLDLFARGILEVTTELDPVKFARILDYANNQASDTGRDQAESTDTEADGSFDEPTPEKGEGDGQRSEAAPGTREGTADDIREKATRQITDTDRLFKNRQFAVTLREAGYTGTPDVPYIPDTEKQWMDEAQRLLSLGDSQAEKVFWDESTSRQQRTVLGIALVDRLGAMGDVKKMQDVATELVKHVGTAAQALRASQLAAKYDFATGMMLVTKAAERAGKPLTDKQLDQTRDKLLEIAKLTEEKAELEFYAEELKDGIAERDAQIADLEEALNEANEQKTIDDKTRKKLERQLAYWKDQRQRTRVFGARKIKEIEAKLPDLERILKDAFEGLQMVAADDQTLTDAFRRWFGDSKVVDADGKPLVVYHGTTEFEDFDEFLVGEAGNPAPEARDVGVGIFFAQRKSEATEFTRQSAGLIGGRTDKYAPHARLIPVYLSIKNPKVYETQKEYFEAIDDTKYHREGQGMALYEQLSGEGYDGIVIEDSQFEEGEGGRWFVAFESNQIKSAIGNRGTFDPNDDSILRMAAEDTKVHDAMVDIAAYDILTGKSPADTIKHLQDLTGLEEAELREIHLEAYESTKGTKPDLTKDARKKIETRRAHAKYAKETRGAEQRVRERPSNYDREVIEYGRANGYSDADILGAMMFPKIRSGDVIAQWKKINPNADYQKAYTLQNEVKRNIKKRQLEAKAEKEGFGEDLRGIENLIRHNAIASRHAKQGFDAHARKLEKGWGEFALDTAVETVSLGKGLSAWGEISYLLRQGFIPLITDTRAAIKGDWQGVGHGLQSDNKMWQFLADKAGYENVAQYLADHNINTFIERIRQHPRFLEAQNSGVRFSQIGDFNIADDHFSTKLLQGVPLYKRAEYAYTLPGDLQRLYMFDTWATLLDQNATLTDEQRRKALKYAAETVNAFTGKGDVARILERGGTIAKLLNLGWFSPQLLFSRFQSLNRLSLGFATAPKGLKWQMAKKGMRFYGLIALIGYLVGMGLDPDDDEFGMINISKDSWLNKVNPDAKDLHINFLAGMDMPFQLYYRTAAGMVKSLIKGDSGYVGDALKQNVREFGVSKYGEPRFLRGKLSPGMSLAVDAATGTDFLGRPFTWWGGITSRTVPLAWQQTYDALLYDRYKESLREPRTFEYAKQKLTEREKKEVNALMVMIGTFTGIGVTQYPKENWSKAMQKAATLSPVVSKKDAETLRQEGGLRNLLKMKLELLQKRENTRKVDVEIQRWMALHPALKAQFNKINGQAGNSTGLFSYYVKDLTLPQLERVREIATDADEIKILDQMLIKRRRAGR